jgi:starch synthase (maltosyl-transferring)
VRFHGTDNEMLLAWSKRSLADDDTILVVLNLDPANRQAGWVELDLEALGLEADTPFQVHDLLGDGRYGWQGAHNYVELDPRLAPAHVFHVRPAGPERASEEASDVG